MPPCCAPGGGWGPSGDCAAKAAVSSVNRSHPIYAPCIVSSLPRSLLLPVPCGLCVRGDAPHEGLRGLEGAVCRQGQHGEHAAPAAPAVKCTPCETWKALCAAKGSAVSMHSVCTAWTACAKCAVPASWALCVALLACSAQGGVVRCACSCRSLELADGACLMIACLRMRMASCN